MLHFLKSISTKSKKYPKLRKWTLGVIRKLEKVCFGGTVREWILVKVLGALYKSRFRREWLLTDNPPHFYNHRYDGFEFIYGRSRSPYPFYRGFFTSEILKANDRLLDIGCGDGFFVRSFFEKMCSHIDAVDIEKSAIEMAKRLNAHSKIDFRVLDVTRSPFPSENYDVIVWDGAIGHFPPSSIEIVLQKIKTSLSPEGIFTGSESLGREGADHLWYIENESTLMSLFKPYFKYVWIRTAEYKLWNEFVRREIYWRCTNDTIRHANASWTCYDEKIPSIQK